MGRSAGNSWRAKAGAIAVALPMLALSACAGGSPDQAMTEKLAAAEAAADKAIAAQHAAEKAAASAAAARPAPAPEPVAQPDFGFSDNDGNQGTHDNDDNASMGSGETLSADGQAIPG
jgi:hypothetical protein